MANPSAAEAVWKDLNGPFAKTGRRGLSTDQVLRTAIIKQMTGYNYSDLAFHLAGSDSYQRFCGFASSDEAPRKSALAHSIKRITAATWAEINRILLGYAKEQGIEDGERVRIDPTVTEANIHAPTDNKTIVRCCSHARASPQARPPLVRRGVLKPHETGETALHPKS